MASVNPVRLEFVSRTATHAKLKITWGVSFSQKEIAASAVYDVSIFLQNDDGLGDPDVRRRRVRRTWVAAQATAIEKTFEVSIERSFLDEDWQFLGVGDTTDEWKTEVILTPYVLPSETKGVSAILRREFGG